MYVRMDAADFSFYQMIKRMVFDEWKKLKTKKKRLHEDEIRKFPVKVRRRVAGVFGTGIITFTQFNNNNNIYVHNIMTGRLNPLTAQLLSVGRLYAGTSYTSYISIIYYVGLRTNYISTFLRKTAAHCKTAGKSSDSQSGWLSIKYVY